MIMEGNVSITCNATGSTKRSSIILLGSLCSVSVATCLTALLLLLYFRLCTKFLYRLASYQVLASLLHALVMVSQFTFLDYTKSKDLSCVIVGFMLQLATLMKICLAGWITFHLFCYAVLFRNMTKLEPLYIVTSLLVPVLFAAIPLATQSYGPTGEWCWIPGKKCGELYLVGAIEQLVTNYAPLLLFLAVDSLVMVVTLITVYRRAHRSTTKDDEEVFGREQNMKAFRQLLPLVAYPITFCILVVPPLAYRAYREATPLPNQELLIVSILCISGYSFSSGLTLIVHVALVKLCHNKENLPMMRWKGFSRYEGIPMASRP